MPVGLMWGNDPTVTPSQVASGAAQLQEGWINPAARPLIQHLGWAGRLDGPVDNARSSCLSCHSTAQIPATSMVPPAATTEAALNWFRNIKAAKPFTAGAQSLDYSLQLSVGVQNFQASHPRVNRAGDPP